jgi:hypothetical protein
MDQPTISPVVVLGLLLALSFTIVWIGLYWRVMDPLVRRLLGKLLGITINLGEQRIWQINQEPVDSLNWRNIFVRPAQMLAMMFVLLVPMVMIITIVAYLSR